MPHDNSSKKNIFKWKNHIFKRNAKEKYTNIMFFFLKLKESILSQLNRGVFQLWLETFIVSLEGGWEVSAPNLIFLGG